MTPNSTSEPELEVQPEAGSATPDTPVEADAKDESPAEGTEGAKVTDASQEPEDDAASAVAPETEAEAPVTAEAPAASDPTTELPVPDESGSPATVEAPVKVFADSEAASSEEGLASHEDEDEDDLVDEDDEEPDDDEPDEAALATKPGHYPTLVPLAGVLAGLVALVSILIVAFALPATHSAPTKLPIGLAGAPAITSQLKPLFVTKTSPFEVTVYPNEAALRTAIEHRKVYGGLTVDTSAATMLVSSAASPVAAETLGSVASELGTQFNTQIALKDVVPAPKKDPRGLGLASLGLPLVVGSMLPALLLVLVYRRRTPAQLGSAAGAALLIGGALAAILTFWLGATDGANYWLLTLALAAGVLATSLVLLGLSAIAGRIGLGIGIAVLVLIAAPLSGLSSAPEWLPHPWGDLGQLLPPGASATLLRSTAFFDGHGGGTALIVLAVWALVGLLLLALGTFLDQHRTEPVAV